MSGPSKILVYGNDSALLNTRAKVLELTGKIVLRATQKDKLEDALLSESIGLLVLCHTLAPDEHEHALELATLVRPTTKRLLITTQRTETPGQQVVLMSSAAGPQALVDLANALLA